MTTWLLGLVPTYGIYLLALATFLSCLAIPIPASMLMLAAGGFISAGDLPLAASVIAALAGAMAGDQAVYFGGRWRGARILGWLQRKGAPVARATGLLKRRGGVAVFLSRWLIPAIGPYVNLAAGSAGLAWPRFTLWGFAGEIIWVGLYVGLGYTFTGNLEAASGMALNILGFVAAGALAVGLGVWLVARLRRLGAAAETGPAPPAP